MKYLPHLLDRKVPLQNAFLNYSYLTDPFRSHRSLSYTGPDTVRRVGTECVSESGLHLEPVASQSLSGNRSHAARAQVGRVHRRQRLEFNDLE